MRLAARLAQFQRFLRHDPAAALQYSATEGYLPLREWIAARYSVNGAAIRAFGLDVITALCERLQRAGVPGLHFYTMNQSTATLEICRRLGL